VSDETVRLEPLDPALVEGLARTEAYPDDASAARGILHLQTHISHVFLTGERVYKLRKSVRFDFLDFATLAERNDDCLREVRLNRRLAPDVYLGVAPLLRRDGRVLVGPIAEALAPPPPRGAPPEHVVVMRRLPDGRDGQSLLERGAIGAAEIDAVAGLVAAFHRAHGLGPDPFPPAEWRERVAAPLRDSFGELARAPFDAAFDAQRKRAEQAAAAFLDAHWDRFERRLHAGRAVDGHADLQLQHLWFERPGAPPLVIDCVEFRDDYRQMDPASDVAFLAMDLAYRRRPDLGERLLRGYAALTDDFDLYGVVDWFVVYRAAVRAKVARLACDDPAIDAAQRARAEQSARDHLALCERALLARPPGELVVMAGIVGSGKSSAASAIAEATGGVVISSDRVRKAMAGLRPEQRGDAPGLALYTAERTRQVYAGLRERALPVLESGRAAILDATYARRDQRLELLAWASARGLRPRLVEVVCSRDETLRRLAERRSAGHDPSDAGPDLYATSAELWEPPLEWTGSDRLAVDTSQGDWRAGLASGLRAIGLEPRAHDR
jgi:hypothetical protein